MRVIKKYYKLIILIIIAIVSIVTDIIIVSNYNKLNEMNKILFTLVTVIAGFWVSSYLLFVEVYKDRYPLKIINNKYLPDMKSHMMYIIYCIIYGCVIIVKNGGIVENICYGIISLILVIYILYHICGISKTLMINTYVDEYCDDISKRLKNSENAVKKSAFKDLRFVLDECIVKQEYFVVQNIAIKLGKIFSEFLKSYANLIGSHEKKEEIEESFENIVEIGKYELELCKDVNSDMLINVIAVQQISNIEYCIEIGQWEWFKKYINELSVLTFQSQKDGYDKVTEATFNIYTDILKQLINQDKQEWIEHLTKNLFSLTTSLNFISKNINLKYFASFITIGLLNCDDKKINECIYNIFENFTEMACKINNGFSDIKVFYALYFDKIKKEKNKVRIKQFFDTIFLHTRELGNDTIWTEFKFYCINEVKNINIELDIKEYHKRLLIEVIEMKDQYNGYMFLPDFEKRFEEMQASKAEYDNVCVEIGYLVNECIVNDNLNMFYIILKKINECLVGTKIEQKDLQCSLLDLFIWMIERTKKINNRQFIELIFMEFEQTVYKLDSKRAVSKDFGSKIISDMAYIARTTDSDGHYVVLQIVELLHKFLKEEHELLFVTKSTTHKSLLYKSLYNIATNCIENDFEEGVRKCSNALGWFAISSIKQGNGKQTIYIIDLAKEMLDISIDLNVSTKTQTFLLTLFTTVGMFCCKDNTNRFYLHKILESIEKVDGKLVESAIKIRTYENSMWDNLLDNTQRVSNQFRKEYKQFKKQRV